MMRASRKNSYSNLYPAKSGSINVLYLRLVELFSIFIIVFMAKLIAGFNYKAELLLSLFLSAAFLQYYGDSFWGAGGRSRSLPGSRANNAVLWYSSYLDLMVVVTLIYLTGTIESPFLFLLIIPLFFASHIFSLRTTIISFFFPAIVLIAGLGFLEYQHVIPHFNCYYFKDELFTNLHYYIGSLLVLGAFLSLVLFLSNAFQGRFEISLDKLRKKDRESEDKILELTRLYDISLGINSVITLDTLLKIVAKEATLLLSQPWASILLVNNKREVTDSVFVGVNQGEEIKLDRKVRRGGLSEWIYNNCSFVVIEDVSKDKRSRRSDFIARCGIKSLIGYPLVEGKQVIGIIYAGDFVPKEFEEKHIRLLTILSNQLAIAIEKSKLYESLERKIQSLEKTVRALERANVLKSDFVSHVSHELKTPLTSIKAYVEALISNLNDDQFTQKEEFLNIVAKETNRLIRIVKDILDVSRIEFGQRMLQRQVFSIEEAIRDVVAMMQPSLSEKNMKLVMLIPENLPKVDADKDLILQVFINLISNAVKYSPEGSTIVVTVEEQAVDICVSVEDEGIGIPVQELGNIFDKYFRVISDESSEYEGAGLGLAIVKNIIEQHGGTIRVERRENKGTKFVFTIPKEHCFNDLLGYISEVVDAKDKLHEMLELIVRMIAELLSAKIVSLMLLDKNRSKLFIKVSYGLEEWIVEQTRVKLGEGIAGRVAESGIPLLIDNIEQNEVYTCPNNPQYETMSLLSVPLFVNDIVVGVINVNNKMNGKPFDQDDMNLLISFSERISRALERVRAAEDSHAFLDDTIEAFEKLLDSQTKTKVIETIVDLAVKVSRKLGLSEKEVQVVQYVASVHDIGMTKISDEILNKALNLTTEERKQIQKHPHDGTELIRPLEFVELVSNMILYHHERVDGMGYPMGLKGHDIPIGSRILAVIDAYQSMTMDKPYRKKRSTEGAIKELVDSAGKQFDAEIVDAFINVLRDDGKVSLAQARDYTKRLREKMASKSY